MKRALCILLVLVSCISATYAQNVRQLFSEGKRLFDQAKYALALAKFEPLMAMDQQNDMVRYASFYYAISAYESGDIQTAKNTFKQVRSKYPNWEIQNELGLWLGKIGVEENNTSEAFQYLNEVDSSKYGSQIDFFKKKAVSRLQYVEQLRSLLMAFPEDIVASRLAELILQEDVNDQDLDLLNQLRSNYDLELALTSDPVSVSPKKSVYNIGLFLPFVFREDSTRIAQLENNWTSRMFYGAKLGVEKLKNEGIEINLITIDTRDGTKSLNSMINSGEMDDLDLIIGPVTQSSVETMSKFSRNKQINMINPLSSNSDILKNNPFAFLYYPSNESLAIRSAEYSKENFTKNKNAAIFYSGEADYQRAQLYRELIEKDSFNVPIFMRVPADQSVNIQQLFVEEEEVDKDSLVIDGMMAEMDSLRNADVDDWEIYSERDFVYDTLKILPDSIGHIFVASDFSSLTTSALSGIAARPDTIEIITSTRFLAAEQSLSVDQLELLNAIFVGSNLIDYSSEEVSEFRSKYINTYLSSPVKEERLADSYLGYDIVVTFGRLLQEHGKYFQLALRNADAIKGTLTEKLNYRITNDNRFMPFLKISNAKVVKVEEH